MIEGALAAMRAEDVMWIGPELAFLTTYLDEGLVGDNTSQV